MIDFATGAVNRSSTSWAAFARDLNRATLARQGLLDPHHAGGEVDVLALESEQLARAKAAADRDDHRDVEAVPVLLPERLHPDGGQRSADSGTLVGPGAMLGS